VRDQPGAIPPGAEATVEEPETPTSTALGSTFYLTDHVE
jgi:hypothetical protein